MPDKPKQLDQIFAYVTVEGQEVCFYENLLGHPQPMVALDIIRVEALAPEAQRLANKTGQSINLCCFTGRIDLGIIEPKAKPLLP